jgi:very-short-patch-repair endonuclease
VVESPDNNLQATARRQHGAFNREQARVAGFTPRMIENRLASGRWVALDRGVYAMASHPFTWERQAMAATLTTRGAVLSGRSAAALHGFDGFRRAGLEITVPKGRSGRTRLAHVRHSNRTQATRVNGIPCLTAAHTILSLGGRVRPDSLDRALDHALGRRLVTLEEVQDRFVAWARDRQPGVADLRRLLNERGPGARPPSTELERRLRVFLEAPGIPAFQYEFELPWWSNGEGRVDAYSSQFSLIVEADGRDWHTRDHDFVKDRRRDNVATAHGHATLRFSWVDLVHYPDDNRLLLEQTLATRSRSTPSQVVNRDLVG